MECPKCEKEAEFEKNTTWNDISDEPTESKESVFDREDIDRKDPREEDSIDDVPRIELECGLCGHKVRLWDNEIFNFL